MNTNKQENNSYPEKRPVWLGVKTESYLYTYLTKNHKKEVKAKVCLLIIVTVCAHRNCINNFVLLKFA